jgi:hypothetical protein
VVDIRWSFYLPYTVLGKNRMKIMGKREGHQVVPRKATVEMSDCIFS